MQAFSIPIVLLPILTNGYKTTVEQPSSKQAQGFLKNARNRRAYSFGEELKGADQERECAEEICDLEEANEIFQNVAKAKRFISKQENQCEQQQCYSDGTKECINEWAHRSCICKHGWTGDDCSQNIDECENHVLSMKADENLEPMCKNGGECYDQNPNDNARGFRCRCIPGWTGDYCETDINECTEGFDGKHAGMNPCKNKAICFNTVGSYSCTCSNHFKGDNCEQDIDQCTENPGLCHNNGLCVNTDAGFECACVDGWGGVYCEEAEKECEIGNGPGGSPCPPGTRCLDKPNGFLCMCPKWGCKNADNDRIRELYYKKFGLSTNKYDFHVQSYDAGHVENDRYLVENNRGKTTVENSDYNNGEDDYRDQYVTVNE